MEIYFFYKNSKFGESYLGWKKIPTEWKQTSRKTATKTTTLAISSADLFLEFFIRDVNGAGQSSFLSGCKYSVSERVYICKPETILRTKLEPKYFYCLFPLIQTYCIVVKNFACGFLEAMVSPDRVGLIFSCPLISLFFYITFEYDIGEHVQILQDGEMWQGEIIEDVHRGNLLKFFLNSFSDNFFDISSVPNFDTNSISKTFFIIILLYDIFWVTLASVTLPMKNIKKHDFFLSLTRILSFFNLHFCDCFRFFSM